MQEHTRQYVSVRVHSEMKPKYFNTKHTYMKQTQNYYYTDIINPINYHITTILFFQTKWETGTLKPQFLL